MNWFMIICWGLCGILNLVSDEIGKFSYAFVWSTLMIELIKNLLG